MSDHPRRQWDDVHREAGYHEQDWKWHELSHDHPLCGHHPGRDGTRLAVRYLEQGHTGAPELELEWASGAKVTVADAAVAQRYLDHHVHGR